MVRIHLPPGESPLRTWLHCRHVLSGLSDAIEVTVIRQLGRDPPFTVDDQAVGASGGKPSPGCRGDRRVAPAARTVVQRRHHPSFAAFNSDISERCSILYTNAGSASRIAAGRHVWVIGFAVFRARLD